jgi:hypothetical protein
LCLCVSASAQCSRQAVYLVDHHASNAVPDTNSTLSPPSDTPSTLLKFEAASELQGLMRSMLSQQLHARPAVSAVPEAAYFKDDRLLRALRFVDTILQRDTSQKHAFVRDLPSFWSQFDKRILRLRVLPCLMHQWQDESMRDAVLPLVLTMAQDLPSDIFQNQVGPSPNGYTVLRCVPDRPGNLDSCVMCLHLVLLKGGRSPTVAVGYLDRKRPEK